MANILEVTDSSFENEVVQSDVPVLVDFWAPWCGPCRSLAPTVEEIAAEYEGKVKVCKVNTDDNMQTAQNFRISGIPTLMVFKGGQQVDQLVGAQKKSAITNLLDKHLHSNN
jgi:thioredoxin 1